MSVTKTVLFLAEPFKSTWQDKDVFAEVNSISLAAEKNNVYREKEGRRTLRFSLKEKGVVNKSYFLKYHEGVGWKEILKNLLQFRPPVLGASNEYEAAIKLKGLGVDTLTPVAYGYRGDNPAKRESFLITEDLIETVSVEDYCKRPKGTALSFHAKTILINKIAQSTRLMHQNGINHRDFYLCHFLLDENSFKHAIKKADASFYCYLIDLHRCQQRKKVPVRWLIKDLGGLLYSTMDIALSAKDYFRFIKIYTGKSLRESLRDPIWSKVLLNAEKLYQKDFNKVAPLIFKVSR